MERLVFFELVTRSSSLDEEPMSIEGFMLRTAFAIGIAGLILTGGSGTTQAAPIFPLPAAATAGSII
jgi:hypothetical protein